MYGDTSALHKENENVIYICNHQCTGNCTSDFLRNYWNMIVCLCVCESLCFSPQLSIFLPVKYDIWIHELYFLLGNINYMLISDIIIIITDLCHLFYVNNTVYQLHAATFCWNLLILYIFCSWLGGCQHCGRTSRIYWQYPICSKGWSQVFPAIRLLFPPGKENVPLDKLTQDPSSVHIAVDIISSADI